MRKSPLKNNHTKVEQYIRDGTPISQIADIFGVSRNAVYLYVEKHFNNLWRSKHNKKCAECGCAISLPQIKFCSKKCERKYRYKQPTHEYVCEHCGETVLKHKVLRFCSKQCANASTRKIFKKVVIERYRNGETIPDIARSIATTPNCLYSILHRNGIKLSGQIAKICLGCGKEFGGTHSKKFCSSECQKKGVQQL